MRSRWGSEATGAIVDPQTFLSALGQHETLSQATWPQLLSVAHNMQPKYVDQRSSPSGLQTPLAGLETQQRPDPLVSVQQARLALARTHAAAQEAASPRADRTDAAERRGRIAMNLSW